MTRFGYVLVTHFSVVTFSIANCIPVTPRLIWNASASVPIGLYAVRPIDELAVGDLVAVTPPEPLARFLSERGYLPIHVPLMKHIAARAGQTVCRSGDTVTIDGTSVGSALDHDHLGRELPSWSGCQTLPEGEVFLMNSDTADSLDGRYFGSLPIASIIGRTVPIWTDADGSGAFRWFAPTS
jgi:conjugative transfer signal peptidase TraF